MKSHAPTAIMSLTRRPNTGPNRIIDCILHPAPGNHPRFPCSEIPDLVFEPSRPTMVGWRWDPDHDRGELNGQGGSLISDSLQFTYWPPGHSWGRALFPEDQSTYQVEAEIDEEKRTIWFPLPTGQSVHSLAEELGSHILEWKLVQFVDIWLFSHTPETCEFSVDFGQSMSTDQGVDIFFTNEDADDDDYKVMHLMMPKDLLRDPIANGSKDFSDGFNPWNQEQKAEITAFLNPYLPRLLGFFETTAQSDRKSGRYISGVWEDGLMPNIFEKSRV